MANVITGKGINIIHPISSDIDINVLSQVLQLSQHQGCFTPSVTNVTQTQSWDCGLACVQMVVRWVTHVRQSRSSLPIKTKLELELVQQRWMQDYVGTQSIWTMDLFALLHAIFDSTSTQTNSVPFPFDNNTDYSADCNLSVSIVFCSDNLGVDESYRDFDYYRDQLDGDGVRVRHLFDIARERNWKLFQSTSAIRSTDNLFKYVGSNPNLHLDISTLVHFISHPDCVAIALIDQSIWITTDGVTDTAYRFSGSYPSSYTGHYVVISDISFDSKSWKGARHNQNEIYDSEYPYCFVIHDPAVKDKDPPYLLVSVECFEKCWRSTGTDSDIILISVHDY